LGGGIVIRSAFAEDLPPLQHILNLVSR
jgi:hypothetical protein